MSITLADVLSTSIVLSSVERDAAAAWARPFGSDVRGGVAACPSCKWLAALADGLDQRITWWSFREAVDDTVPERANAIERQRAGEEVPSKFTSEEIQAAGRAVRGDDAAARKDGFRILGEYYDEWSVSELGYALSLHATREMLEARIEELRANLDLGRMEAALGAWPEAETQDEREERFLRESDADKREVAAMPERERRGGLHGSAAGRAIHNVSPARLRAWRARAR